MSAPMLRPACLALLLALGGCGIDFTAPPGTALAGAPVEDEEAPAGGSGNLGGVFRPIDAQGGQRR